MTKYYFTLKYIEVKGYVFKTPEVPMFIDGPEQKAKLIEKISEIKILHDVEIEYSIDPLAENYFGTAMDTLEEVVSNLLIQQKQIRQSKEN